MAALSNNAYQRAHEQMQVILGDKAFHLPPPREPWWSRLLDFITAHLHFSISQSHWRMLAWVLTIAAVVVVAAGLVWWIGSMYRTGASRIVGSRLPAGPSKVTLRDAEAAYRRGDYRQMLGDLVVTALALASSRGWVKTAPYKTLRMYVRDLGNVTNVDFREAFRLLADSAERVLFAESALSDRQAEELLTRVRQVVEVQP